MRIALLVLAAMLLPVVAADTETGSGIGMDLGVTAVGTWDIYWFDWATLGSPTLSLAADQPPVFFADYDLLLYHEGTLDDGLLEDDEIIARSVRGGGAPESITTLLAPGRFVVAVVPYQTQGETYTLTSSGGALMLASTTVGTAAK